MPDVILNSWVNRRWDQTLFIIILTVMWTNSSIYETSDFKLEAVSERHVEHPNIADHTWPKLFLLSF